MPKGNMTDHQKNQLLDALMYRLKPAVRAAIMAEVPAAYNAFHGREIVAVMIESDGRKVTA